MNYRWLITLIIAFGLGFEVGKREGPATALIPTQIGGPIPSGVNIVSGLCNNTQLLKHPEMCRVIEEKTLGIGGATYYRLIDKNSHESK